MRTVSTPSQIKPLQDIEKYDEEELSLYRKSLLLLLKSICNEDPETVREMILGMLNQKNGYVDIELEYLTELWSEIGDEDFLIAVLNILSDPQNPNNATAEALGAIMSAEYVRSGLCDNMDDWVDVIEELIDQESEMENKERTPQLSAIAHFLLTLDEEDKRLIFAVDSFLSVETDDLIEAMGVFILPMLFTSEAFVADYITNLASEILSDISDTVKQGCMDTRQALILYALSNIDNPSGLIESILPHDIDSQTWLNELMLTKLLAVASMESVPGAYETLSQIESGEITITEETASYLFDSSASYFATDGKVYDALIDIAIRYKCGAELCNFINAADWQDRRLLPHISKLFAFGRELLRGDEIDRINGMGLLSTLSDEADDEEFEWSEYHELLESLEDPEMLCELLRAVGFQNEPDSVDERISYFREYIEIRDNEVVPVCSTAKLNQYSSHCEFRDIAESIRAAFLEILTLHSELNDHNWNDVRILSLYTINSEKQEITCTAFAQVCNFIRQYAFTHNIETKQAESWLSQYLSDIVGVEFIADIPDLYCDALKEIIVTIMNENADYGNEAIELAKNLSVEMAMCIISIVADNNYEQVREKLNQIASEISSLELKTFVLDLIRDHDRSVGTRVFVEILETVIS